MSKDQPEVELTKTLTALVSGEPIHDRIVWPKE